jgi:hypothetical protein
LSLLGSPDEPRGGYVLVFLPDLLPYFSLRQNKAVMVRFILSSSITSAVQNRQKKRICLSSLGSACHRVVKSVAPQEEKLPSPEACLLWPYGWDQAGNKLF